VNGLCAARKKAGFWGKEEGKESLARHTWFGVRPAKLSPISQHRCRLATIELFKHQLSARRMMICLPLPLPHGGRERGRCLTKDRFISLKPPGKHGLRVLSGA